jgi:DNA-binding NarL/FixJ family response regulator
VNAERKVLVISKHPLFNEGLQRVLVENPNFKLMKSASSVEEALELFESIQPDVIIFDKETDPVRDSELAQIFELAPERVVTLSMDNSTMTIFTRHQVEQATVEDLVDSILNSS